MGEAQRIADADSIKNVVLTDHAERKGFNKSEIKRIVRTLQGDLYWDHQSENYHLYDYSSGRSVVFDVNGTTAFVVTVFPAQKPSSKYSQSRFTELRHV